MDYAVSFADTPEEAAGYADVVISSLEFTMTIAGAVGSYKATKAMGAKLANLKAYIPAKVKQTFGVKVAGRKANLQTVTKAEVAVNKTSTVESSLTNVVVANVNQALEAGKIAGASTKELSECNTIEFAIKMAEYQYKKNPILLFIGTS